MIDGQRSTQEKKQHHRTICQGSLARLLATSETELIFLIVTEEALAGTRKSHRIRHRGVRGRRGRVATAACIVALDRKRALKAGRAAEAHLAWTIAADSAAGRIDSGLVARINEQVVADLAGQFRVSALNEDQLGRLLGTPELRTSRTAMLSEDTRSKTLTEIAQGIAAAAGAGAAGRAVGVGVATRVAAIAAAEAAATQSAVTVVGVVSAELGASWQWPES